MKKAALFAIVFACCTMTVAAQGSIRVNCKGANPTISDFVTAILAPTYGEDGEENESMNGIPSGSEYNQDLRELVNEED